MLDVVPVMSSHCTNSQSNRRNELQTNLPTLPLSFAMHDFVLEIL
jgi:hypothetical protein